MANTTEKAIGIIFLVVLILVAFFAAAPFFFYGFRTGLPPFISMNHGIAGAIPFGIITFALLVLWVLVIVWVYRDAERRGMSGVLWALLVFIGNVLGLLIYLIVRNDTAAKSVGLDISAAPCASCGKPVPQSFSFCPHCGRQVRAECPSCHKTVSGDWLVCPYCGMKLAKKK